MNFIVRWLVGFGMMVVGWSVLIPTLEVGRKWQDISPCRYRVSQKKTPILKNIPNLLSDDRERKTIQNIDF